MSMLISELLASSQVSCSPGLCMGLAQAQLWVSKGLPPALRVGPGALSG